MLPNISVRDLWEQYRVLEDRSHSLKEFATRFKIAREKKSFWALQGVSFDVAKGETLGLIGENGSGKSTLLRCIAGILPPTRGSVLVGGTVSSLIELGAGFHPELTGRENVFLAGALFGLTRARLKERFDSIVTFADIGRVIDQPVRAYSSGMYVRLAFSLAIHVQPDILLIDEVLAVGDEAFQRKCIERVAQLGEEGVTIVFVSHDLPLVEQVCRRTVLLDEGKVIADGTTPSVVAQYLEMVQLS
jgi:ABC-type polysaccharide/polyol phosphate transport system ATPase subunit